jgi:sugar O-acyltransferase (sialic acid O-acetyltransferase NeuD family)
MSKPKLILIGGGGHCKSCIDVIVQEGRFEIEGILDLPDKVGMEILGYPIIGTDFDLERLTSKIDYFFITLGQIKSPESRVIKYNQLKKLQLKIPVIISPHAYVSRFSTIGEGTIIMHFAQVNANAKIGVNCIINSKALVEHDAQIGDHCHVSTGAIINGGVIVGDNSFVGTGAKVLQYLKIGSGITIGAGAVVTKNLTEPGTYVGIPSKKL